MQLSVLLGNQDRPIDRPTDGLIGKIHYKKTEEPTPSTPLGGLVQRSIGDFPEI